jgi:hypothetical protein
MIQVAMDLINELCHDVFSVCVRVKSAFETQLNSNLTSISGIKTPIFVISEEGKSFDALG